MLNRQPWFFGTPPRRWGWGGGGAGVARRLVSHLRGGSAASADGKGNGGGETPLELPPGTGNGLYVSPPLNTPLISRDRLRFGWGTEGPVKCVSNKEEKEEGGSNLNQIL